MNSKQYQQLEEELIKVGLKIAKRGEGALFVVGNAEHSAMVDQTVPPFEIVKNPKLLESLALMDGAVIIDEKGFMRAYGVIIKSRTVFKNAGTRHSAALSASKGNNLVVLVSEEDRKVKILKSGKMVMQIDALEKNVEKSVSGAVSILESVGAGAVGTLGASLIVPTLGVALLPGIVVFGSAYYLGKVITQRWGGKH